MNNVSIRNAYKKGIPYKICVDAYENEKAVEERNRRLGRLLSMTHLLLSEAMLLTDEFESMMSKSVKETKSFKPAVKKMNFGFEMWRRSFEPLVASHEWKNFHDDFDAFDANVRQYAKLSGWKETTKEDEIKTLRERIINLHKEFVSDLVEYREKAGEEQARELLDKTLRKIDLEQTETETKQTSN